MKICTMEIASDIEGAVRSRCKMVIINLTIAKITEARCICKLISQNHMYVLHISHNYIFCSYCFVVMPCFLFSSLLAE